MTVCSLYFLFGTRLDLTSIHLSIFVDCRVRFIAYRKGSDILGLDYIKEVILNTSCDFHYNSSSFFLGGGLWIFQGILLSLLAILNKKIMLSTPKIL